MTSNHSGIADADYSNDETHHAIIDRCIALCLQVWSSGGIQCQICHMTFSDQSAISAHYDTAHAQSSSRPPRPEHPDARYECEVCGRKFIRKLNLKQHLSSVHGVGDVKTFQCDVCSYVAKQKGHLKRHLMYVHCIGDVKTFQCHICSRVFKHKHHLKDHLKNVHKV